MNDVLMLDDDWDVTLHQIQESASEVDGQHILAKVRGPAFFPDTTSGNRVFYPMEAWENAINDELFRKKLLDRRIFGTIGHKQVIDDDAIKDGKFSHIVTDVYIGDDGIGYAEYLIVNTPTGRILNTIIRAGSKMRVSTKAKGLFSAGSKSVNPKIFFIERIDFVLDPGYDEALPELIESLDGGSGDNTTVKSPEEPIMDPKDQKPSEGDRLISFLESQNEEMKEENKELEKKVEKLEEDAEKAAEEKKELEDKLEETSESLRVLQESLQKLGTPEEIEEALTKSQTTIEGLQKTLHSALQNVSESLMDDEAQKELAAYRQFGTLSDLQDLAESAEKLADDHIKHRIEALKTAHPLNEALIDNLHSKGMSLSDISESLALVKPVEKQTVKPAVKTPSSRDFRKQGKDINESQSHGKQAQSLSHRLLKAIK